MAGSDKMIPKAVQPATPFVANFRIADQLDTIHTLRRFWGAIAIQQWFRLSESTSRTRRFYTPLALPKRKSDLHRTRSDWVTSEAGSRDFPSLCQLYFVDIEYFLQ